MPARAIWKGVVHFGKGEVPVKLYSVVQDQAVHFNLLHDQDMTRVQQQMVNPVTGEVVPKERIRKGYPVDEGVFVFLDDEELKSLEPPESRDIEILRFVEPADISHQWYDRPYMLGPDEDGASDYFALIDALGSTGKEGVARWVMRRKQYHGALRVDRGYLMLITLRHADEVIPASQLEAPQGRKLDPKELNMAEQLVGALEDRFNPADYQDEHRERVRKLIEAKARGGEVQIRRPAAKKPAPESLASMLEASVKAVRREKEKVHG